MLAIQAIKKQEITSIREAARVFKVLNSTLSTRLLGIQNRANSHKVSEIEEESLEKWIFSMDARGSAPRPSMVQEMANVLLSHRGINPSSTVGKNWVTNYIKRHPNLSSRFSRR